MDKRVYVTKRATETQEIARKLAQTLKGGEVLALFGELGSGKTTFTQGLAEGLGLNKHITSPTFIIMRTYEIQSKNQISNIKNTNKKLKMFYHIDLYRIESEKDLEGLGLKDILNKPDSITVIEWPEKMGRLLKKRIDIQFEYINGNERRITIE